MLNAVATIVYDYTACEFLWTEDGQWSSATGTKTYDIRFRTGLDLAQLTGKWANSLGYDAAKRLTSVTAPAGTFSHQFAGAGLSTLVARCGFPMFFTKARSVRP